MSSLELKIKFRQGKTISKENLTILLNDAVVQIKKAENNFTLEISDWSNKKIRSFLSGYLPPLSQLYALLSEYKKAYESHTVESNCIQEFNKHVDDFFIPKITNESYIKQQSNNGKKDRTDKLAELINKMLLKEPNIKNIEILRHLRTLVHGEIIESITDEVIEWSSKNGTVKETKISSLPNIISRERKKLKCR